MAAVTNATGFTGNAASFGSGSYVNMAVKALSDPWTLIATLVVAAVTYDQVMYIWRKHGIVGPMFKIPFMGPFLESLNPKFEQYMAKWKSGPLSCVSVFHKDMARKVFNSPTFVKPCVVDIAPKILRPTNWVFLDGKAHVDYRKGLNGLFTRQALGVYLPGQEEVYDKYFKTFVSLSEASQGKPVKFMHTFREFLTTISCRTFVGHYLDEETIVRIDRDYYKITEALDLVNFPIILPFTRPWYGKKAADMVLEEFSKCSAKSKARMAAGGEPTCIMDAWIKQIILSSEYRKRLADGVPEAELNKPAMLLRDFTDFEISQTIFTFLFASQDATSSAVTWLFQIMAQRPDVLAKVKEEQIAIRGGDIHKPLDMDLVDKMVYTRAVVKELLRYRPPVTMVPYEAKKPFPITDTYTVPKGAMVIPTLYPALHDPEVYPNPDYYDPERWITGDAEKASKNWLVFGTGPHYCLGQNYAIANLMCMIGKASMFLEWEHHATPLSEEIKVFATIFPMDDCPLVFRYQKV